MIGLWSFLAIAVVASSVAQIFRSYFKSAPSTSVDQEILKVMKAEIEKLKSRVANLETIASSDLRDKSKTIWNDYQVDKDSDNDGGNSKNRAKE